MKAEGDVAATPVAAQESAQGAPAAAEGVGEVDGLAVIDPRSLRLHRGPTGALRATLEGEAARSYLHAAAYRAFPLSESQRWAVLLDGQGKEIGMLRDPAALDPESAALLAEELELRYLTPRVREVADIREDTTEGGGWSPTLVWDLVTDRGPVRMRLPNLVDHVRRLGERRYVIQDREGRRVEIEDAGLLPAESRRLLGKYLWV